MVKSPFIIRTNPLMVKNPFIIRTNPLTDNKPFYHTRKSIDV